MYNDELYNIANSVSKLWKSCDLGDTGTIESFWEKVKDVSEFTFVISILRQFKTLVTIINILIMETREITFGDINILDTNFKAYRAIYECTLLAYSEVRNLGVDEADISEIKSHFDQSIKAVQNYMVRSLPNLGIR